jgi:hypothetical protein
VLPERRAVQRAEALRKDGSGYDLKQLLIGAEGTLGVVTAASLKLFPVLLRARWPSPACARRGDAIELLGPRQGESGRRGSRRSS